MNKIDLIKTLSATTDLPKIEAARTVKLFFDQMATTLKKYDRVEIRGLCSFYANEYEGYTGRHPKAGEMVEAKRLPLGLCVGYAVFWLIQKMA